MVLSRIWYAVLGFLLAMALFLLYLATGVSNRNGLRAAERLLTSNSRSVEWFLRDDSRQRAADLIVLASDPSIVKGLDAASKAADPTTIKSDVRQAAKLALQKFREEQAKSNRPLDALWAVDRQGRVLANENFEQGTGSKHYELGGYSLVADALHGWIRDDAWVFDGRIYRVVARPVEKEVQGTPVGAIIGAKIVDDRYAKAISDSTGAAVAFFAERTRIATGAPASFDRAALEITSADVKKVEKMEDYQTQGRTRPFALRETPNFDTIAIFSRLHGDAWDLGAGYVVGHRQPRIRSPTDFSSLADQGDKDNVPIFWVGLIALAAALLGLLFTVVEHTMPLRKFRAAIAELGSKKTNTDVLKPSTFRGVYKKIALNVNDALDKVAGAAGIDRGPADLENVLGPLPAQPQMSAFAVPGGDTPVPSSSASPEPPSGAPRKSLPKAPPKKPLPRPPLDTQEPMADVKKKAKASAAQSEADSSSNEEPKEAAKAGPVEPEDEAVQWKKVYGDFVELKKSLGENTDKLTYEKFKGTLQRNKDALVARHNCSRVKFRVYEKEGKAALKASPIK